MRRSFDQATECVLRLTYLHIRNCCRWFYLFSRRVDDCLCSAYALCIYLWCLFFRSFLFCVKSLNIFLLCTSFIMVSCQWASGLASNSLRVKQILNFFINILTICTICYKRISTNVNNYFFNRWSQYILRFIELICTYCNVFLLHVSCYGPSIPEIFMVEKTLDNFANDPVYWYLFARIPGNFCSTFILSNRNFKYGVIGLLWAWTIRCHSLLTTQNRHCILMQNFALLDSVNLFIYLLFTHALSKIFILSSFIIMF